jgi:hypothetical protein
LFPTVSARSLTISVSFCRGSWPITKRTCILVVTVGNVCVSFRQFFLGSPS